MGWRIIQQPDGKFARFTEVVNNFTHYDMSEDEAEQLCSHCYGHSKFEATQKIKRAKENPDRWKETLDIIKRTYGEFKLKRLLNEMGLKHD